MSLPDTNGNYNDVTLLMCARSCLMSALGINRLRGIRLHDGPLDVIVLWTKCGYVQFSVSAALDSGALGRGFDALLRRMC